MQCGEQAKGVGCERKKEEVKLKIGFFLGKGPRNPSFWAAHLVFVMLCNKIHAANLDANDRSHDLGKMTKTQSRAIRKLQEDSQAA